MCVCLGGGVGGTNGKVSNLSTQSHGLKMGKRRMVIMVNIEIGVFNSSPWEQSFFLFSAVVLNHLDALWFGRVTETMQVVKVLLVACWL